MKNEMKKKNDQKPETRKHQPSCVWQVLVHCKMGRSRSATLVLMYLVRSGRMTLAEAWRDVKACRRQLSINKVRSVFVCVCEREREREKRLQSPFALQAPIQRAI